MTAKPRSYLVTIESVHSRHPLGGRASGNHMRGIQPYSMHGFGFGFGMPDETMPKKKKSNKKVA
jgi:hypothetical protein